MSKEKGNEDLIIDALSKVYSGLLSLRIMYKTTNTLLEKFNKVLSDLIKESSKMSSTLSSHDEAIKDLIKSIKDMERRLSTLEENMIALSKHLNEVDEFIRYHITSQKLLLVEQLSSIRSDTNKLTESLRDSLNEMVFDRASINRDLQAIYGELKQLRELTSLLSMRIAKLESIFKNLKTNMKIEVR